MPVHIQHESGQSQQQTDCPVPAVWEFALQPPRKGEALVAIDPYAATLIQSEQMC